MPDHDQSRLPPEIIQQQTNPLANYKFSPDEIRVLKQCNADAFFERSLPLASLLAVGAYYGVQKGFLKASVKYGPTPKVLGAVVLGYFVGKFSYQNKCAQKIMQLPNSKLAQVLRQRKFGDLERISIDSALGTSLSSTTLSRDIYTDDAGARENVLDMDLSRPYQAGLDDTFRPNVDWDDNGHDDIPTTPAQHTTTYDELRRKNRDEYQKARSQNYRGVLGGDDVPLVVRATTKAPSENEGLSSNKYGDKWD